MKVTLIHHTPGAEDILIFTKNTRLKMSPNGLEDVRSWPQEKKQAELEYMAKTIPSSWEFIDVVFLIEGVTRAFANQLVRTRTGSYAQQSMRVTKMEQFGYETGPSLQGEAKTLYETHMKTTQHVYDLLCRMGVAVEDARGILPLNIHTNIVAKYNFRTFCELVKKRSGGRVQGEYREVLDKMVAEVSQVWPWADTFFKSKKALALRNLDGFIKAAMQKEIVEGKQMNETNAWDRLKELDLLRDGENT